MMLTVIYNSTNNNTFVTMLSMIGLETVLGVIAPHECISCTKEGTLLCQECSERYLMTVPERCYRCLRKSRDSMVCAKCRPQSRLKYVWVGTEYEGLAKELVYQFKFERSKAGYKPIAERIIASLPYLPPDTIVTHIPTATSRHRARGYDQAQLIAQEVARRTQTTYLQLLERHSQTRQVGATKKQRFEQAAELFRVKTQDKVIGKTILIIDDILTTGASVEAAAVLLKRAGAKQVNAAVFAQKH